MTDFEPKSLEMRTFFVERAYPTHLLDSTIQKAFSISRRDTLKLPLAKISDHKIPLVLTFHLFNYKVRDVSRVDFSPFHSIVYVHPPPTYSFRASTLIDFKNSK